MPSTRWLRAVVLAIGISLTTSFAHAMLEGTFLYFPSHRPNQTALTEWLINEQLSGYARLVDKPREVWLVCHGNAGQATSRLYLIEHLPADASVFVLEYPGYGLRPGKPSMKSINAAALQGYAKLRETYPDLPVNMLGESLGSGAASYLCSQNNPPDRLVLMVPFDNLLSVAKRQIKFLPVGLLMRDKWDNTKALAGYRGPVDIFAATHDTVIPASHARNLAKSIPQASYTELPCQHNEWSLFEESRITN